MGPEQQPDVHGKWFYPSGLGRRIRFRPQPSSSQLYATVPEKVSGRSTSAEARLGKSEKRGMQKKVPPVPINVGLRTRKRVNDAYSFTKWIQDVAKKKRSRFQHRGKNFAFAYAETISTYNSICVAHTTGDFNQEKRLRGRMRLQLKRDREKEWTSKVKEFEKAGRTRTREKPILC
ncbi:hypothetical protein RB195_024205 [Necator americanus]|uniref:Uncharacterized protein n=1 Tax=Necator americanus TaxID=51031 RepID=A0ABR1EM79_NECAM